MSETDQPESKVPFMWLFDSCLRQWRRAAVVLLLLAAALLVIRTVADVWIGHEVNDEVARLEKLYGPLDPATLAPRKVPSAENRARIVGAAANLVAVDRQDRQALDWFSRPAAQLPAERRDEVRRLVERNDLALQVAAEARRSAKSDWQIDYDTNLPRLSDLRDLGSVLALSCRLAVDGGRTDQAVTAALSGLAAARSLGDEPNLLVHLVRIDMANRQYGCVCDLLQRGEPSASLLSDLASLLAANGQPDGIRTALVGELKRVNRIVTLTERGAADRLPGRLDVPLSPAWAGAASWLWRPLIRYGHLHYLRSMSTMIDAVSRQPFQGGVPVRLRPQHGPVRVHWWNVGRRFDEAFVWGMSRVAEAGYEDSSAQIATELSVALRRFRLERGTYPDSLLSLVPQYFSRIPLDPFTGRPPDYARAGVGFNLKMRGGPDYADDPLLEWKIPR